MTTHPIEKLAAEIEEVVRKHLAAYQSAAAAAVERAFASTPLRACPTVTPRRTTGRRRPAAEVAALAERVCVAVCANPGETMTVIAPHVGEPARALHRPMMRLKRAGRVRSAGQRHMTRYFPMSS